MKQAIKKRWISALKSGKYKQGKKRLAHAGRHCCLGVLADLAIKDGVCSYSEAIGENCLLTDSIRKWSGIETDNPEVEYEGGFKSLASLNDDEGLSFRKIAEYISSNKI